MGDEAGRETEECLMDVVTSPPSDPQVAKTVQPDDGALDHPTEDARARAVPSASFGDDRPDTALPQRSAVSVVVVAAADRTGSALGPSRAARTWKE